MVLSLYLGSPLGIILFRSLDKFGGAFEEPPRLPTVILTNDDGTRGFIEMAPKHSAGVHE
jgi:hypothetical protein